MKIAFLSVLYPFRGGIAQSNAQLYRAFEREGHDLKAWNFSTQYPSLLFPGTSQYVNKNDQADPIPNKRTLSSINPITFYSTARQIIAFQPDFVFIRYWMPFFAPSLGTVAGRLRKKGIKVITLIDNLIPHEQRTGDQQLTRYFLNRNDACVVMSDVVEKDLKNVRPDLPYLFYPHPLYDQFGSRQNKGEARNELGISKNQKVLLYFGLIRKYKGLDILIKAFNRLDESYELLIVGEPYDDFSPYQNLIDLNRNTERIHAVTKYVSDKEVPAYFSAADVCVLPYRSATQSGVIAISYHFDLPVIVTDVGGLRGTVEPFGAGIVVDQPDDQDFSIAIESFFKNDNPEKMENAIQQFKEKYTWDGMAKEIVELVRGLENNKYT